MVKRASLLLGLSVALLGCGVDASTGSPSSDANSDSTSSESTPLPVLPLATPAPQPTVPSPPAPIAAASMPDALEGTEDLWAMYGNLYSSGDEAEFAGSIKELSVMSDVVVLGRVSGASLGRLVDLNPEAPTSRLQFIDYTVDVERGWPNDVGKRVSFELPVIVSSPELDAAVSKATQPSDQNGDGLIDDEELAKGYNGPAVLAAYAQYWEQALDYTLKTVLERLPNNETIFFLRSVPTAGAFRPVNGDSVIVNDAGVARAPWREGSGEAAMYAVAREVAGVSFAEIVERSFDARG